MQSTKISKGLRPWLWILCPHDDRFKELDHQFEKVSKSSQSIWENYKFSFFVRLKNVFCSFLILDFLQSAQVCQKALIFEVKWMQQEQFKFHENPWCLLQLVLFTFSLSVSRVGFGELGYVECQAHHLTFDAQLRSNILLAGHTNFVISWQSCFWKCVWLQKEWKNGS